jgi:dTDP-4-dehydrorhamnose reductase
LKIEGGETVGIAKSLNHFKINPEILIVGIDGTIGSQLYSILPTHGWEVYGTSRDKSRIGSKVGFLDLRSPNVVFPSIKFSAAIICAAITSIDKCDENPSACRDVNVVGTIAVIDSLLKSGTFVVYISTNAVFDGSREFVSTTETPNPLNKYGSFKLEVEQHLRMQKNDNFAILRITKLITNQTRFIVAWRELLEQKKTIPAYTNRFLSPVSIQEVESALSAILKTRQTGVFHLGGQDELSYFEFAKKYFSDQPNALKFIRGTIDPLIPLDKIQHNSLLTSLPG